MQAHSLCTLFFKEKIIDAFGTMNWYPNNYYGASNNPFGRYTGYAKCDDFEVYRMLKGKRSESYQTLNSEYCPTPESCPSKRPDSEINIEADTSEEEYAI